MVSPTTFGRPPKLPLPEPVTQTHDRRRAGDGVFVLPKPASDGRPDAEHVEVVRP